MSYETETDYSTVHYRCIDPIENLRIRVILQPVKSLYIPLPQFDVKHSSPEVSPNHEEKKTEKEECVFKWQEKVFSKKEIAKYSGETDWKKKLSEKYHICSTDKLKNFEDYSNKIFSYVEPDEYSVNDKNFDIFTENNKYVTFLSKKINRMHLSGQSMKNYKNIAKRNVVNYYPSNESKNQAHLCNSNIQKMFIMVDLSLETKECKKGNINELCEGVLCTLIYDYTNHVLQMTPSFTKSEIKPYVIGLPNKDGRSSYYYWIYHTSQNISSEKLTKEIQIMDKMFEHQRELRKLQVDKEFFTGKPDHAYITLVCEIISAEGFEYDNLHIHYFIKLPSEWSYNETDSLRGSTQRSFRNHQGICHFSHLFEMNFCLELNFLEDVSSPFPELFFEVLSLDNYNRYRNEGYTYFSIPKKPGMYNYTLKCWRVVDQSIRSMLNRFFVGGGVELEDVSCVGFSPSENQEKVMSRFGTETIPEGEIKVRFSVIQQSKIFAKKSTQPEEEKIIVGRLDSGELFGSLNAVLEAFRRARERMLTAKKGLQIE